MKIFFKVGALAAVAGMSSQLISCNQAEKEKPETTETKAEMLERQGQEAEVKTITEEAPSLVEVGDNAPGFTLADQDGNAVSLSDFEGKNVVLVFARAHW